MLNCLKKIEGKLGRNFNGLRFGPRPLDLDIIFYGDATVESATLQIPHPRLSERSFVLGPLTDLLKTEDLSSQHWSNHHTLPLGGIKK